MFEKVLDHLGDYGDEIRGVYDAAKDFGYGDKLTVGELTLLNFMYEVTVFCTSIVAKDNNGRIIHGRNMDYDDFGQRNITGVVEFTQDGEVVYQGTAFLGYVGLLTGMRPHAFSVTINQREHVTDMTLPETLLSIAESILSTAEGGSAIGFAIRDTLGGYGDYRSPIAHPGLRSHAHQVASSNASYADTELNFSYALHRLSSVPLIAKSYLIIGGTQGNEGAVVTRGRHGPDQSQGEGVWTLDLEAGVWFRVQTNYDHWLAPPADDDRSGFAIDVLSRMDRWGFNELSLFHLFSTPPVLNQGSRTLYTTVMVPAEGRANTVIRGDYPQHKSGQQ